MAAVEVRLRGAAGFRRVVAAIAAAAGITVGSVAFAAVPASAEVVYIGGCTLAMTAHYSPAATLVPNVTGISYVDLADAGSTCVTNFGVVPAWASGRLGTPPITGSWGCASGVVNGWFKLLLPIDGYPNLTVDATVVNVGGTMNMVATFFTTFDGLGTFAQAPLDTAACAAGGSISNTTWTGTLVFQDPPPES